MGAQIAAGTFLYDAYSLLPRSYPAFHCLQYSRLQKSGNILNCLMGSSLTCFCTLCCSAIPTSCYISNVFYYLFMLAASAHAWAEVFHHTAEVCHRQPLIYGQLTQALATLAVLADESLTQAPVQTLSQPFSGWMTKPALPL